MMILNCETDVSIVTMDLEVMIITYTMHGCMHACLHVQKSNLLIFLVSSFLVEYCMTFTNVKGRNCFSSRHDNFEFRKYSLDQLKSAC